MYVAELRKLTENCSFEANLNDALRDRYVCGIQTKLLSMSDLTLQKAIEIPTAMEIASKDAVELQHQHRPDPVNKLRRRVLMVKRKMSKTHVSFVTGKKPFTG